MSKRSRFLAFLIPLAIVFALPGIAEVQSLARPAPATLTPAQQCAALARFTSPDATITAAVLTKSIAVSDPDPGIPSSGSSAQKTNLQLPEFCRVEITLTPSSDSDIKMEVWMPVQGWNGRFRGQGNGGFAGVIDYDDMATSVTRGFATAGSDGGHASIDLTDALWALGHPEKVIDFGYRAVHLMTTTAKAVIAAYYGTAPTYSYFSSCSDGGREALMEAQRFPADYNGIIAGDPANNWSGLLANAISNSQALAKLGSYIPPNKLSAIADAVNAACDRIDGVSDGILNDPRKCEFKPSTMLCGKAETGSCLTSAQVTALEKLYAGSKDSTGTTIFPGYMPGGETGSNGWSDWITGSQLGTSLMYFFGTGYFSDMVYANPSWDYKLSTVDADYLASLSSTGQVVDATDPDLTTFIDRGGKLILYHGWSDSAVSPLSTIHYFESMQSVTGEQKVASAVRLYMAPGMQHCDLGPGPDSFGQTGWKPQYPLTDAEHNMYVALMQWVEDGTAPASLIATKYAVVNNQTSPVMTRPLCPYPQQARYKGSGNTNASTSYTCAAD
jgi:feruloyl esterase